MRICIKRLYIWIICRDFYISPQTSFVHIVIFVRSLTVLSYTQRPVQTSGDPGIAEDLLGYFSAIVMFLQTRPIPGETHVPRAGLASCHPQRWFPLAVSEGVTQLSS